MADYNEVDAGLDDIALTIRNAAKAYDRALAAITNIANDLASIPTVHADTITTIDGYAPTGAFETLAKDKKGKFQEEFLALKAKLDALIATTEFTA